MSGPRMKKAKAATHTLGSATVTVEGRRTWSDPVRIRPESDPDAPSWRCSTHHRRVTLRVLTGTVAVECDLVRLVETIARETLFLKSGRSRRMGGLITARVVGQVTTVEKSSDNPIQDGMVIDERPTGVKS